MEQGLREVCRSVRIGKILIQRVRLYWFDIRWPMSGVLIEVVVVCRTRRLRSLSYSTRRSASSLPSSIIPRAERILRVQLPQDIANRYVLLLDPMLGTPKPLHTSCGATVSSESVVI